MSPYRDLIVEAAKEWAGTPYHDQASVKGAGCDCIGLIRGVWREIVGPEPEAMPPYTPDWAEATGKETMHEFARRYLIEIDPSQFTRGDVLMFRMKKTGPAKHASIATADDMMMHAYQGANVCETHIGKYWRNRLAYVFQFPGIDG